MAQHTLTVRKGGWKLEHHACPLADVENPGTCALLQAINAPGSEIRLPRKLGVYQVDGTPSDPTFAPV